MIRKQALEQVFKRGHLLNLKNKDYLNRVKEIIGGMINEDLGKKGDITANSVLKENNPVKAIIKAKENGILAGVEEATYLYKKFNIEIKIIKKDGSRIKKGDTLLILQGKIKDILKTERTGLNILLRMSGIASLTDSIQKKTKIFILGIRKAHWGLVDQKAVYVGGGYNHRFGLHESILIKENHLEAIKKEGNKDYISTALTRAWKNKNKAKFIEIEVQNIKEAILASKKFKVLKKNGKKVCIVMLDNFTPEQIKRTIHQLKKLNLYNYVLLEASGGIDPMNIKEFEKTGVDAASIGFLTHSPKSLDISQVII